jgi:NADH/NAD ratio-sensing transcriptional regulator Rex
MSDFWKNVRFISAGLGGFSAGDGKSRSPCNVLEGFQFGYSHGCRMFEVDISLTDDGYVICTHQPAYGPGGDVSGYYQNFLGITKQKSGLTYAEFMSFKPWGEFTVLDLKGLIELAHNHPDAFFVLDTKYRDKEKIQQTYTQLINGCHEITKDKSLIEHFIPEISTIASYNALMDVYKFKEVVYNPHRYTIKIENLLKFLDSVDNVHAITTYLGSGQSNDFGLILQDHGYYCLISGLGNMEGYERYLDYGMTATWSGNYASFGIQFQIAEKISQMSNVALFIPFQLDIDFDLLRNDLKNGYDIVILGVGKNGRALLGLLKLLNITVKYFCDVKSVFVGKNIGGGGGVPVLSPEELKDIPGKFSYIFGTDYFQLILDKIIALDMLVEHRYHKISQLLRYGESIYRPCLLSIFNELDKLEQFQKSGKECVVWGAGGVGSSAITVFEQLGIKISFIVDNNAGMWGKRVRGIEVKPPDSLTENEKPLIIASRFFHKIYEQLLNMNLKGIR